MFLGKKVIVLGAARSGISAAEALLRLGAQVTLTDITPLHKMPEDQRKALQDMDIRLVTGSHPVELLDGVDLIVKNPGISPEIEFLQAARKRKIHWISELELAWLVTDAQVVAITGTNGKTTTTALTGEIFTRGQRPVTVGGNIGLPLTSVSFGKAAQWLLVVETSSFQLEDCYTLQPKVAVYTNITPDHLDRHKTLENYIEAKLRLVQNQTRDDFVIVNLDDPVLSSLSFGKGEFIGYSLSPHGDAECYIKDGYFCWQNEKVAPVQIFKVPGAHNLQNALAAIAAAKVMGIDSACIAQGLEDFAGVEHRLEFAGEQKGIKFYNDSKATNPESTITALKSFEDKVILLAGGYDKGADFQELSPWIEKKVKHLFAYGNTGEMIQQVAQGVQVTSAADLAQAFQFALEEAEPGDTILLSPACASWDQYKNFEERGQHFKALVQRLGG